MPEPLCEWATCDDTEATPGSLYCKPHGRQARLEGAPWRRPGAIVRKPEGDAQPEAFGELPEGARAPRSHVGVTDAGELFTRPAPAPRRSSAPPPPAPATAVCRVCGEPALAKTISAKPNRWSNLCERHYTEARRNALGPRRREQLAAVLPAPSVSLRPDTGPFVAELEAVEEACDAITVAPETYTERAAHLVQLAAAIDDARWQLDEALEAWRAALVELA